MTWHDGSVRRILFFNSRSSLKISSAFSFHFHFQGVFISKLPVLHSKGVYVAKWYPRKDSRSGIIWELEIPFEVKENKIENN